MAGFLKKLSLVPTGLRYKLTIAFVLMSIIPLTIGVYLAWNYIFWNPRYPWDITDVSLLLGVTIIIALLGFKVSKDIISPIIDLALKAKVIAKGDLSQSIDLKREDEIGELGSALNVLTRRIRENMDELRSYGERTKEINVEINKKVIVLSGLLQIGNLISQGSSLEQILEVVIEKISQLKDESAVSLLLVEDKDMLVTKAAYNLKKEGLKDLRLKAGTGFLGCCVSDGKILVLDRRSKPTKESGEFLDSFGLRNCVIAPVTVRGQGIGALCFGSVSADYEFSDDDVELLKLFTRQIAIAVENERLTKKAKELSIKDELTGLYNDKYITGRLDEEIKRAILYQRPCSFAILNIDDFNLFHQGKSELAAEETIKKIGKIIEVNVTEVDRVGRLSGDEFAVVMPEKNKKQANTLAEILRQRVEAFGITAGGNYPRKVVTVSGGVSENPLDGATSDQLIKKARASLEQAKSRGKNVVVS